MKHFAWVVLGICCAAGAGAEEVNVFTPSRLGDAPVYMNAKVVRIDRAAGTITVRNDSGQSVLNVDRHTLAQMGGVKAGSNVILGLHVTGSGSTERRIVTDVRPVGAVAVTSGKASAIVVTSGNGAVTYTPRANAAVVVPNVGATAALGNTGSPVLGTGAVPQLGGAPIAGINSQIPSVPPAPVVSGPVLPAPTVMVQTTPPRTPIEVATVRELATRDFDLAVAVLAARAAEVDRAWAAYRAKCVTVPGPLNNRDREWFGVLDGTAIAATDDLCGQSYDEVARLATGVRSALDNASDNARQADVLPGRMREVLQRYNLDL